MLSTKNVTANKLKPVINPGNHVVKINDLTFEATPYDPQAYNVVLHVETQPIGGDFQGFLVDPNNQNGPRYQGQVGRVRMSPYPYKDATLPNGRTIERDQEIVKAMAFLADVLNKRDEVDMIEANTIAEFMNACKQIFSGSQYFNACIGGREWKNNEGYINVDLHLPRMSRTGLPLEALDADNSRLLAFNYDEHVRKVADSGSTATAGNFEPSNANSSSDFDL
ncbi:MAG: hypothetical protein E6R13_04140 [Spirochaetes bacterium]|nr:MAG: hypothetical protein E6R13_04140 [Spirochaetota bacterium]